MKKMTDKYTVKSHEGELDEDDDDIIENSKNKSKHLLSSLAINQLKFLVLNIDGYFINNDYY